MKEELLKKVMEMGLTALQQMPDVAVEYVQMCAFDSLMWVWGSGILVLFCLFIFGLCLWGAIYKDSPDAMVGAVFALIFCFLFLVVAGHNYIDYTQATKFPKAYLVDRVIHLK